MNKVFILSLYLTTSCCAAIQPVAMAQEAVSPSNITDEQTISVADTASNTTDEQTISVIDHAPNTTDEQTASVEIPAELSDSSSENLATTVDPTPAVDSETPGFTSLEIIDKTAVEQDYKDKQMIEKRKAAKARIKQMSAREALAIKKAKARTDAAKQRTLQSQSRAKQKKLLDLEKTRKKKLMDIKRNQRNRDRALGNRRR